MDVRNRILGGYCGGVPPLPIPNREVKPTSADGTAMQCGRVGNRLLLEESSETKVLGLSFFVIWFVERRRGRMWGAADFYGSVDFRVEVARCVI